jgi:hypothetical protein
MVIHKNFPSKERGFFGLREMLREDDSASKGSIMRL